MSEEWDEKAALECANGDPRLAAFHKELCEIADENPSLSFRLYCAIDTAARRAFCDRRSPPAPAIDVEDVANAVRERVASDMDENRLVCPPDSVFVVALRAALGRKEQR